MKAALLTLRTFSRKTRPTGGRPSIPRQNLTRSGNPFLQQGSMQKGLPADADSDPNMREALKNMQMFDDFVKGSDFEKKLEAFLSESMASGKDPEAILQETLSSYQRTEDPFDNEEAKKQGVEFDPSDLKIDPELFRSFETMMQGKETDPQMEKFMASMMEDAARLQQKEQQIYDIGDEKDDSDLSDEEKVKRIAAMQEDEEGDLEALKSTKAAGGEATQASREELEARARNIFGRKKPE